MLILAFAGNSVTIIHYSLLHAFLFLGHCEQTNKSNKKVESPKSRTTLNNLINLAKESTKTTTGAKKEVDGTVIDKKPPPPPPPSTQ